MKDMKIVYNVRNIIVANIALILLIGAFFKNSLWGKIIIAPFIICAFALMCENIFHLLNKEKVTNIFKYIFRISFFVYVFGFLLYAVYYVIINKVYSVLIVVAIFLLFTIRFINKTFFHK